MSLPAIQVATVIAIALLVVEIIGRAFDYSPFAAACHLFLRSFLMVWDTFDLLFQTKLAAQVLENNGNLALVKLSNGKTIEILRRNENLTVDDFNVKYAVGRLFPARATLCRKQTA